MWAIFFATGSARGRPIIGAGPASPATTEASNKLAAHIEGWGAFNRFGQKALMVAPVPRPAAGATIRGRGDRDPN